MEALVLVIALITLLVSLATLCLVATILYVEKREVFTTFTNQFTKTTTNNDTYTPDYVEEEKAIEDFEPDFSRPIKIKTASGSKLQDFVTGEGEKLTPIQTDPLEDEDEGQR